jgi:hypothetical protein
MGGYFLSTRAFVLGVAIAVAALATGCGSSGSGGSTESVGSGEITVETGSLSKADFITRADAICAQSRTELEHKYGAILKVNGSSQGGVADEIVNEALVPAYEQQIDEISALGAPSGDEKEVTAYLEAIQLGLEEAQANPAKTVQRLTPFGKAIIRAKAYGLKGCAESLG